MDLAPDTGLPRRSCNFENSGCGPVFESPCSRRGCSHVFTYSGTNPFVDLAAMVAAHRRHCVRRREVRCATARWQPPASLIQQFTAGKSVRRDAMAWTPSFEDRHVEDMDCKESWTDDDWGSPPIDDATGDGGTAAFFDSRRRCTGKQLGSGCAPISASFNDRHVHSKEPWVDNYWGSAPIDDAQDEVTVEGGTTGLFDSRRTCAENKLGPWSPPISAGFSDRHADDIDCKEPWTDDDWGSPPIDDAQDDVTADGGTIRLFGNRRTCTEKQHGPGCPHISASFGGRHLDSMDCEDPRTDEASRSSPIGEGGDTRYDAATNGASELIDRRRTSAENQFVPGCSPISAGGHQGALDAGTVAPGDTVAGTRRRQKVKKTARKEAERKALLEADPWALAVSATKVECGGCRQTIKLDARSRYYPGLWEKHRDRCDGVRMKRAAALAEEAGTEANAGHAVNVAVGLKRPAKEDYMKTMPRRRRSRDESF
ncbi:hypothetical protein GGX14DRAFT_667615 [Mycena pura]|uniref:Uncharacterized protein n=1 Tax=Mycena pura TaxID=153505 RepID=A0AAD6Y7F0_9AGAR|nr:hypothetical protein GGX14DRAFT_667615 [Mycena pura]